MNESFTKEGMREKEREREREREMKISHWVNVFMQYLEYGTFSTVLGV